MIHSLIQNNYGGMIVSIFLILFIVTDESFKQKTTRLFLINIVSVLLLILAESVEVWAGSWDRPSMTRNLASAMAYTLRPAIAFEMIMIIRRDKKEKCLMMGMPLIVNTVVAFISCFYPIMFEFTSENEFVRGPLGYLPFIVSGWYLCLMAVYTIGLYKNDNKKESIIGIIVGIMSCVATFLETLYDYKGFLDITCAISVVFYYLYLHTQKYKRDSLTKVLNRRCFYLDGKKLLNSSFSIISIDLNNLKQINDRNGHAAGDLAICTMVECVSRHLLRGCTLYRTGGDEFMMICVKHSLEAVEAMIKQIREEMSKTEYSCAIGVAHYELGKDFDKVCGEADAAMYINKNEMKRSLSRGIKENQFILG